MDVPFDNVLLLLLYLLPGFLAQEFYRARYPAKKASEIATLIWSVLHTFVIHLILALLSGVFAQPSLSFLDRPAATEIEASSVFILLVSGFVWGLVLTAWHWARIRFEWLPTPDPLAIYPRAMAAAAGQQLWALVRLHNGDRYLGWVVHYSYDPELEHQDFYLSPAFLVDDQVRVVRDFGAGGVYVDTRNVSAIEFLPGTQRREPVIVS